MLPALTHRSREKPSFFPGDRKDLRFPMQRAQESALPTNPIDYPPQPSLQPQLDIPVHPSTEVEGFDIEMAFRYFGRNKADRITRSAKTR